MAKSKKNRPIESSVVNNANSMASTTLVPTTENKWALTSFRVQAILLAVISLLFYANTFTNEYALDDNPIIINNEYVQSGTAGIGHILTGDALESLYKNSNTDGKLSGGRYRPLSIVTFAIEQQLLGINAATTDNKNKALTDAYRDKQKTDMHFRHIVNVMLYIVSIIVLLLFLRKVVFKNDHLAAFITALVFTIHPLHTEVVANVKSRDEIMSLLFICLTFITAFRYQDTKRTKDLVYALLCFFLALMSKEYAAMLVLLLPLSFYYFHDTPFVASFRKTAIFMVPFGIYLMLRFSSVAGPGSDAGEDVLNNPYVLASSVQKIASIFAVMLDYIKLLIFPHPLSSDYSYNQIPYSDFSSAKTWVSVLTYSGLVAGMAVLIRKKHIAGFAIAFFIAFLLLVCNLFINIGAPMGERLIYHSSVGFTIVLGWLGAQAYRKLPAGIANPIVGILLLIVTVAAGIKTITRNGDWKNDVTLFLHDVNTVPNSAPANAFAGGACLVLSEQETNETAKKALIKRGIKYITKAITINYKYTDAYVNRGLAYLKLGDYEQALNDCDTVERHFPSHPKVQYLSYTVSDYFFNLGLAAYQKGNYDEAFPLFAKALRAAPNDADLTYNVGFAFYNIKKMPEAKHMAEQAVRLAPNNERARQLYIVTHPEQQQPQ